MDDQSKGGCLKRLLMVAFHFPPLVGGSGIQRTLRFLQHLPEYGWQPLILSASPRCYAETGGELLNEIPEGTVVQRSFALDAARHLSVRGRYFGWTARPDRWMSWQWAAVADGMQMIERYKPDAIWSTYPIATAHRIGAELQRRSGLPWVADFRDPMAQEGYPSDPLVWQSFKKIEEAAIAQAACCVFTTPGAASDYARTYPAATARMAVVENGYDEESFSQLPGGGPLNPGKFTVLHSGIVYPSERDPTFLFEALSAVIKQDPSLRSDLRLRFRAPVHDALLENLTARYGLHDIVEICPPVSYKEALAEMCRADALLVMQATNCNAQIPAKFYEYLRAGRPLVGLADPVGDTAVAMREAGAAAMAPLDNAEDIAQALTQLVRDLRTGRAQLPEPSVVRSASRNARAQSLATLLECAIANTATTKQTQTS
jgi:glycosyltransferase involved in cell wall biosynthesis